MKLNVSEIEPMKRKSNEEASEKACHVFKRHLLLYVYATDT